MVIGNANVINSMAVVQSNNCTTNNATNNNNKLGPLVDDGAPYSVIGEIELGVICNQHYGKIKIDNLPSVIAYFQY